MILSTSGWSRECPKPKTQNLKPKTHNSKPYTQNPASKLPKSQYQNLGSIPPVPKPQKSISKFWAAFPLLLKSARVHVDICFCQSTMKADPLAQQLTVLSKTRKTDLKLKTYNRTPKTQHPNLKTPNLKSKTQNQNPKTQHPKPKTQNLKPKTQHLKRKTQNGGG